MTLESRGLSTSTYGDTTYGNTTYGDTTNGDSNDLTKVLIGALAGAAVGSLVAGAFPQQGIEIRNRVG